MEKVKVMIGCSSDGTICALMENEMFAGMGATVEDAVKDLKEGVALFIETAKANGFPYNKSLDNDFEIELADM